jgi:hypothetical protein
MKYIADNKIDNLRLEKIASISVITIEDNKIKKAEKSAVFDKY